MATSPAVTNHDLQNEGEKYENLLEILEKYIDKEADKKPYLVKNGVKVIL